jgi:hypothetical protein
MSDEYDVFAVEKKPAPKVQPKPAPEPEPAPEEAPPNGLTKEEFEKVRRDIFRMWNPEPEEIR